MKLFYHSWRGRGLDSTLRVAKRVAEKRVGFVPPGLQNRNLVIPWKEICEIRADHARGDVSAAHRSGARHLLWVCAENSAERGKSVQMSTPKLELVHLSPTADSRLRWADGTLKGIKTLRWTWMREENGVKQWGAYSPLHSAEWVGARLVARDFWAGEDVRGQGGIHAIWPPQLDLDKECAALDEFGGYAQRKRDEFTVLVSGWGRCVMGDVGWRAEHCRIRTVINPPRYKVKDFRQWCRENGVGWSVI